MDDACGFECPPGMRPITVAASAGTLNEAIFLTSLTERPTCDGKNWLLDVMIGYAIGCAVCDVADGTQLMKPSPTDMGESF